MKIQNITLILLILFATKIYGAKPTKDYKVFNLSISKVVITPDGQKLIAANKDGLIKVVDIKTKKVINTMDKHNGYIKDIKISNNNKLIVSGGQDGAIVLWNLKNNNSKRYFNHSLGISSLAISPDGKWIASSGEDRKVILIRVKPYKVYLLLQHYDRITTLKFTSDSKKTTGWWMG